MTTGSRRRRARRLGGCTHEGEASPPRACGALERPSPPPTVGATRRPTVRVAALVAGAGFVLCWGLVSACGSPQRPAGTASAGAGQPSKGGQSGGSARTPSGLHPTELLLLESAGPEQPLPVVTNEQPGGDRFLRSVAGPAPPPGPALELLLARMQASLLAEKGVGIAAPQVGISRRVIWVKRVDQQPDQPLRAYLDPVVVWRSDETIVDWEGCLSVPAGYGQVRRAKAIRVRHRGPDGEPVEEAVEGFAARIFEHEIDHLEGQLFLDVREPGDLVDKETYRKRKRQREQGGGRALRVDHLFTDLDGTLLLEDGSVSPENMAALQRYRSAGGHVGVATGRLPEHGLMAAIAIGADLPLIFANGAVVMNPDATLRTLHGLKDPARIKGICAPVAEAGCQTIYTAYADLRSGATRIVKGACAPSERPGEAVVKIRARQCRRHAWLLETLVGAADDSYSAFESGSGEHLGVSVAPRGVDKGTAIKAVLDSLEVSPERVAFTGDSGNDVAAAAWLHAQGGRCFAMLNATPDLKAACPQHTRLRYDQGGVGEAVLELLGQAPPHDTDPPAVKR